MLSPICLGLLMYRKRIEVRVVTPLSVFPLRRLGSCSFAANFKAEVVKGIRPEILAHLILSLDGVDMYSNQPVAALYTFHQLIAYPPSCVGFRPDQYRRDGGVSQFPVYQPFKANGLVFFASSQIEWS